MSGAGIRTGWLAFCGIVMMSPAMAGNTLVIDGDTVWIDGTRVRLQGIDAPEAGQSCIRDGKAYDCGAYAAAALRRFIAHHPVQCRKTGTDRYGRTLARCEVSGIDLGSLMVRSGWALDDKRFSGAYYRHEQYLAQTERRGLWAGSFQLPWQWRRRHREQGLR